MAAGTDSHDGDSRWQGEPSRSALASSHEAIGIQDFNHATVATPPPATTQRRRDASKGETRNGGRRWRAPRRMAGDPSGASSVIVKRGGYRNHTGELTASPSLITSRPPPLTTLFPRVGCFAGSYERRHDRTPPASQAAGHSL
jgi:hypothetical protein